MARIGLVLGAGGKVGHAFHAGVLAGIGDATGWDARDAAVIVGTSAGSVVGAWLRAGVPAADLAARATGTPLSDEARHLFEHAEAEARGHAPIPSRPPRPRVPFMSAPAALARHALAPWRVRPGVLAAAAMPAGRVPTEVIAAGLRACFPVWPESPLWLNAVALDHGRRVTFGRDGEPPADVASAVAASCAIPSFFAPVRIGGMRYVDGGVHSPTNADLLDDFGLDLAVVVSPMSTATKGVRIAVDEPARRLARFTLAQEVARLRRAGTPVLVFQPTDADLAVMGRNAMDGSRRAEVARHARASARRRLVRPEVRDLAAILTAAARAPAPAGDRAP
jgi:NTE family protein